MEWIDLRSDTVTKPTAEMREAMANAEVGDDVYGDDPTVNRLEALAAEMLGKEAALFVPTGTMGNQLAVMTHTRPGQEIIAPMRSHIVMAEGGGAARLSGVAFALVDRPDNFVTAEDVVNLTRPTNDYHYPQTGLVWMENATTDGNVIPLQTMRAVQAEARSRNLPFHLDGARIFNTALALGVSAAELAACADSVMFCISKSLCAPVGSLLCGSGEFIHKARWNRKMMGGGMRQAGVLAACGLIALEKMTKRLDEDHENARLLGEKLAGIPGIEVFKDKIRISMVWWKPQNGFDSDHYVSWMKEHGVLVNGDQGGAYRLVTSNEVSRQDVDRFAELLAGYVRERK